MKKKATYDKRIPYYNGDVIFSARDSYGDIVVVENETLRTLHFDSSARQSAISLDDPDKLELSYCRAMLAGLLFIPKPRSALILGLGGGSLAKFLLERIGLLIVEAVELRQAVVQLAHDYFLLPKDKRLSIDVMSAEKFLLRKTPEKYESIFIDLFTGSGMAPALQGENFFNNCKNKLSSPGFLSVNLWGGRRTSQLENIKNRMLKTFGEHVYFLPVPQRGNIIAISLNFPYKGLGKAIQHQCAKELQTKYQIEFVEFLNTLVRRDL